MRLPVGKTALATATAALLLGTVGCGQQTAEQTTAPATPNAASGATSGGSTGTTGAATSSPAALVKTVQSAFAADAKVAGYKLQVQADPQGLIIIKGAVPDDAEKYRVEQIATDAIKNPTITVDNQLTVGAAK